MRVLKTCKRYALIASSFYSLKALDATSSGHDFCQGSRESDYYRKMMSREPSLPVDLNDLSTLEVCDWWTEFSQQRSTESGVMDFFKEDDLLYKELLSRASQIECDTIEALIGDEIISGPFGLGLIMDIVPLTKDSFLQFELLQIGMSTHPKWPEQNFDGFHVDFLELMWKTLDLVDEKILDSKDTSKHLELFFTSDKFWRDPIVLTSIVALKRPNEKDLKDLFERFLGVWDFKSQTLKEDNPLDIYPWDLGGLAPLLAVSVLSPSAPLNLIRKVLDITTWSECEEFGISFWEYVCALVSRFDDDAYWAPLVIWRDGFFSNGLCHHQVHIEPRLELECLLFYFKNRSRLDFETVWGERCTQGHVLKLLSKRSDAEENVRRESERLLELLEKDMEDGEGQ